MSPHAELRSRSPREGVKKDEATESVPEEKEVEEKKYKRTRQEENVEKGQTWTDEEWAEWRKQQDQRWKDCEQWYSEQVNWRAEINARNQAYSVSVQEELTKVNAQAANTERRLIAGEEKMKDLVEATTLLTQYAKEAQVDTSTKQLKVLGWRKESREERRIACDRWIRHMGMEAEYDTTKTLEDGSRRLLPFSLLCMKSKDARDEAFKQARGCPIFGLYGETCFVQKNMPRYQREAGGPLRWLMAVLEAVIPNTTFSKKDWEQNALKVGETWVALILPGMEDQRLLSICVNEAIYTLENVEWHAKQIWKTFNGWDKRAYNLSSSSTSSTSLVQGASPKVYYFQDHYEFIITKMEQGMFDTLDAREAEQEEEKESRAMGARGKNWKVKTQPKHEEDHPMAEEAEVDEGDGDDSDLEQLTRDKKGNVVAAKYVAKKKKKEPEHFHMDEEDDEEEDDLAGPTSSEALSRAKANIQNIKHGGYDTYNSGKKKKGSSADAVWHAKSSLGYDGYDTWQEDYVDQHGYHHAYNSEDYREREDYYGGQEAWALYSNNKKNAKKQNNQAYFNDYYGNKELRERGSDGLWHPVEWRR